MLSPDTRQVKRLRLRAASEDDARPAVSLIEDALHTASIPHGLVLVRHLPLGVIRKGTSSAGLARKIEEFLARLAPVAAIEKGAGAAEAVYFRGAVEALAELGVRIARRAPSPEWFWPMLASEWDSWPIEPARALPVLAARAARTEAGIAAAIALIDELRQRGALPALLADLTAPAATALIEILRFAALPPVSELRAPVEAIAAGETRQEPPIHSLPQPEPELPIPQAWRSLVVEWTRVWGLADARTWWLAQLAVIAGAAHLRGSSVLLRSAAVSLLTTLPVRRMEGESLAEAPRSQRLDRVLGVVTRQPPLPDAATSIQPRAVASTPATSATRGIDAEPGSREPAVSPGYRREGLFTGFGGLYFAVHIFERLGLPVWLEDTRRGRGEDWPAQFLSRLWTSVLTEGDPMLAPWLPASPELRSDVRRWWIAAARWCRRNARVSIRDVVCRPGLVDVTRTHITVTFDLNQADLQLRTAGLDFNPGWVPWMERVVYFRYEPGVWL